EERIGEESARGDLAGRVHLLGWRDDIPALLRDADVVVSCARQEPLGVVILPGAGRNARPRFFGGGAQGPYRSRAESWAAIASR
ncbi:MAG: hypothetical protein ACE5JG_04590, partial [Planctomycetota bacterium]